MARQRKKVPAEQRRAYDRKYKKSPKGRELQRLWMTAKRRRLGARARVVGCLDPKIRVPNGRGRQVVARVTVDQFVAMDEAQDFCCAICGGEMLPPHIDHCHRTHKIRGLLCRNCNSGIGLLGDDPARMIAAAKYVT